MKEGQQVLRVSKSIGLSLAVLVELKNIDLALPRKIDRIYHPGTAEHTKHVSFGENKAAKDEPIYVIDKNFYLLRDLQPVSNDACLQIATKEES